jgi:hypothetical protein
MPMALPLSANGRYHPENPGLDECNDRPDDNHPNNEVKGECEGDTCENRPVLFFALIGQLRQGMVAGYDLAPSLAR